MKTKILFLAAAFVLTVQGVGAQEATAEVDSVMLAGKVVNHHSHRIYPNCYMRFVQEGRTVAETTTDAEGGFVVAALPVGRVELHVRLKGLLFHQADLDLRENAYLTVAVDTIKLVTLKAITVVATKHMLGSMQITSIHDRRLWGFNGGYRDANAVVAMPPDAHGNSDAGEDGGVGGDGPVGTPLFDPAMPWQIRHALMTGKLGTLLMTPPIWEVVPDRVVKADSTRAGTAVSE
jgi:hypothetical protein